jgi:hypothetical protein
VIDFAYRYCAFDSLSLHTVSPKAFIRFLVLCGAFIGRIICLVTSTYKAKQMNITVTIKSVYGVDRIYPACEHSQLFADIAGTKTLERSVIERIKKLGYTVTVSTPAVAV